MNKYLWLFYLSATCVSNAMVFSVDGAYNVLAADVSTSSTSLVDTGLSVSPAGYTGAALVLATYSAEKSNNSQAQDAVHSIFYNGTQLGQSHTRNIPKSSSAAGSGSATGIVTVGSGLSSTLRHASGTGSPPIATFAGSSMSAIPLTSGGVTLGNAYQSSAVGSTTSNTTPTAVLNSTSSSFNVAAVHDGTSEIFVSASFDVSASAAGSGTWQLQYKLDSDVTWSDMGQAATRDVTTDSGVVTIVALANLTVAGDYQVRLAQSSASGGVAVTTSNIDIAAVSLAVDATSFLQSHEASSIASTGATLNIVLDQDTEVFAAANITATSASTATGEYELTASDGTTATVVSSSTRQVGPGDTGSVGLNAIVTMLAAGTNTYQISSNNGALTFDPSSNFVAFELTATTVPEPATSAAIMGIAAVGFALSRRRPLRK